ncbi:MAG: SPOR domain-containing protein [Bacteroidaceae bacterium]|nr:SPOR domain-containing protein [Bacteroidaceae bacterium]
MKQNRTLIAAVVCLLALTGCRSSANAYQQAYEKAIQNDVPAQLQTQPENKDVVEPAVAETDVTVRQEKVTLVTGDSEILTYGVVCGSYSLKANAEAVMKSLQSDGFSPSVAVNEAGKTYRVIVASFNTREEAAAMRDSFKKKYPENNDFQNSWLLYNK